MKYDDDCELLIDLLEGALNEEGYETKRYSKSDKNKTTSYDAIDIRRFDNVIFTVSINKKEDVFDPFTAKLRWRKDEMFR